MSGSEWSQRIINAVHALGRHEIGGLTRAEKRASVAPSYIRQRKRAGTVDLRKMLTILEALNEHPGRFFRRVFPGREHDYRTFVQPPTGPQPDIIKQAQRRLDSSSASSIPRSHLEELDRLRHDQPERVKQGVVSALDFVSHDDVAFALGVWASAQRLQAQLSESTQALLKGLAIAEERQAMAAQGDLLQRLSYVVADCESYEGALAIATLATDCYARSGDRQGIGRSMVDRGAWLHYLGQNDEAIAMQKQALPLLADEDTLFQVAARQVIGYSLTILGEPEMARSWVTEAWSRAHHLSTTTQAKLTWLEASIATACGDLGMAESKLRQVVRDFSKVHYGEAAVAAVELAETQLKAGKPAAAYETTQTILPFITPLGRNRFVRSAELVLVKLARRGIAGMSTQVFTNLRDLLNKLKRERHSWRSLRQQS